MRHRSEARHRTARWLPRRLRAEVERHRRLVGDYATGPSVDLTDLADLDVVAPGAPGPGHAADGAQGAVPVPAGIDVVGVLALATADDPVALLAAARGTVGAGGRLLLFEPYRRPRWRGRLSEATAPVVRAVTGLRPDLPVPRLVRQAGFVIGTIERVPMPTLIGPLRSFCLVVAHPAATGAPDVPGTDAAAGVAAAPGVRS